MSISERIKLNMLTPRLAWIHKSKGRDSLGLRLGSILTSIDASFVHVAGRLPAEKSNRLVRKNAMPL